MGLITNGFLISSRKSAGGINFYKRKGIQCFRNKPVRSAGYQESPAQAQQNSVFSLVSAFKNNAIGMEPLIRGGWGASVSGKGRTAFNNWSSEVLKAVTRDVDGRLLQGDVRAASIAAFESNPGKVFRERCDLTRSKYPAMGEGAAVDIAVGAGAAGVTLTIPEAVITSWKASLPTSYQASTNLAKDIVYLTSPALGESVQAAFLTASGTLLSGVYSVDFPAAALEAGDVVKLAYGAAPAPVGDFGQSKNYAIADAGTVIVGA